MTIAKNPSPWYLALFTYKTTQFPEYGSTLGALAYRWLNAHGSRLNELLDGEADYVTAVPSKKGRWTYETQPLRRALAIVSPMAQRLREVLRCNAPMSRRLTEYDPSVFDTTADVEGDRIILVEDTWLTGATALSAAGTLIEAGARSVVITPIARDMRLSFHGDDHPYLKYLEADYDIGSWPR